MKMMKIVVELVYLVALFSLSFRTPMRDFYFLSYHLNLKQDITIQNFHYKTLRESENQERLKQCPLIHMSIF